MSISVYTLKIHDNNILPKIKDHTDLEIDLSFYKNWENSHYILIKDLSRMISKQISNHNGKNIFIEDVYHILEIIIIYVIIQKCVVVMIQLNQLFQNIMK